MDDVEQESGELISWGSDSDGKNGEPPHSDDETYADPLYVWFSPNISYSVGVVRSEGVVDVDTGNIDSNADGGADPLSVMYPPCQDPILVKIYQGLPALPCVAVFFFFMMFLYLFFQAASVR